MSEAQLPAAVPAPGPGDALLVVDLQHDFLPGGALGIRDGDAVIGPVNDLIRLFGAKHLPVFVSRDWHPADHCSFRAQGGPWPPHCVAGSHGAEFTDAVHLPADAVVVSKATRRDREAYSALDGTGLHEKLQARDVHRLFLVGLATDYCVKETVRDALALGYAAVVVRDGIAAVDAQPGDGDRALQAMRSGGAVVVDLADLQA